MVERSRIELLPPPELARPGPSARAPSRSEPGFGAALAQALEGLDALQQSADAQAQAVARGSGNLHEMAIALEQADIAMRLATKVRNKLVETYQEVMRMSV